MTRPKDFTIPWSSDYRRLFAWETAACRAIDAGWMSKPGELVSHRIICPCGEVNTAAVFNGVVLFEIHETYANTKVTFNKDLPVPTPPEPVVDESLPY